MFKIVRIETIRGLLTVDIDGALQHTVIGHTLKDSRGNQYILQSVAMHSNVCSSKFQTLVLYPTGAVASVNDYIIEE